MMFSFIIIFIFSFLTALPLLERLQSHDSDFLRIHRDAIVIDGHNDIVIRVLAGENIEQRGSKGHSDLVRFQEGKIDAQILSLWASTYFTKKNEGWKYIIREMDSIDAVISRNNRVLIKVRTGKELETSVKERKIALILNLEGGHAIEDSKKNIIILYNRGLRIFGITWEISASWASSARDEANKRKDPGLTPFGKSIITLLDSLGILVDVSHLGERSFYDVLATTKNPVIASHSSCSSLCQHYRNLSDDQIKAIAKTGGIVMVNFYPPYIKKGVSRRMKHDILSYQLRLKALRKNVTIQSKELLRKRDAIVNEARMKGLPTIHDVIDHIEHVISVAGINSVGLGSDFEGIDFCPVGLEDVAEYPMITRELLRRGYSEHDTKKILGSNFIRVFSSVCR